MKLTKKTGRTLVKRIADMAAAAELGGSKYPHADALRGYICDNDRTVRKTVARMFYAAGYASGMRSGRTFASGLWRAATRLVPSPQLFDPAAYALPLDDFWTILGKAAETYGVAIVRPGTPTVQAAPGSSANGPAPTGLVSAIAQGSGSSDADGEATELAGDVPAAPGCGVNDSPGEPLYVTQSEYAEAIAATEAADPATLVRSVALSRALRTDTRDHEHAHEDGERLRSDGASAIAAGLTHEPVLAYTVRKRSDVPAVLVLVDWSGSMNWSGVNGPNPIQDNGGKRAGAATLHALGDACRHARVPFAAYGFSNSVHPIAPFGGRPVMFGRALGDTNLEAALATVLPILAKRRERRKILLVVTDGQLSDDRGVVAAMAQAAAYARARGVELYGIGLGIDLANRCEPAEWRGTMRLDNPADLQHVAARELARVIHR